MVGIKNQYFGVEIEMTGIRREKAAKVLARYFGTEARHIGGGYDAWEVTDRDGKVWKLLFDGSIQAEQMYMGSWRNIEDRRYKVEMVTPKLGYDELPKMQECIRQVRKAGAKVNDSCGLHVHIDASNHNQRSLKNLLSIMYSKEDILFRALQVNEERAQQWCRKVREPVLQRIRQLRANESSNYELLQVLWYEYRNGRDNHYDITRYHALNLHSVFYRGTVEFRCFNSTLHAGRAAAYVNLCLAMSAQAISQHCTVMRKTQSDNELFTFRTWLVRMGLNGEEFKNTRDHLLANLAGNRAWRYDRDSYEHNRNNAENQNRNQEEAR